MTTPTKITECLEETLKEYKKPVTQLSKTSEKNDYITNETHMFDWDNISKEYDSIEYSSVDAIYCSLKGDKLILYFFEFKKHSLYDEYFDAKKQLSKCIEEMELDGSCSRYIEQLKDIKKGLYSKKINSLKMKPLESLILLYKILDDNGIKPEDLINIEKEYYIVSETPIPGNKSNFHRKGRSKEIFSFIDIIKPYPFINVEPINKTTFVSLINNLEN